MPQTGVEPITLRFISLDAVPFSHKILLEACGQDPYFVAYHYITFSDPPTTAPRPARLEKPSPASGKTPVQDPKTPTGDRPQGQGVSPTQEAALNSGKMAATTKDARDPIQEVAISAVTGLHAPLSTQEAGSGSCEMVATTKSAREPIQEFEKSGETRLHAPSSTQEAGSDTRELESPTKDAREPIQEVEKSTETELLDLEAGSPTKEAREPIQVSTSKDGAEGERLFISKMEAPLRVVQEGEAASVRVKLPASDAEALIQELESPTKEAREPIQEVSPPNKEAAMPTEVTSEGKGSHGLPEMEGSTDRRTQESRSRRSVEQLPNKDGSIRSAVKERKVTKGEEGELEVDPGRRHVFQEDDVEDLSKDKKVAKEEKPLRKEENDFEEFDKGKPLQETRETGKEKEEPSGGKPLQESESSAEAKNESSEKDSTPAQETMAAGKGPFEETGHEEGKLLEETQGSLSN